MKTTFGAERFPERVWVHVLGGLLDAGRNVLEAQDRGDFVLMREYLGRRFAYQDVLRMLGLVPFRDRAAELFTEQMRIELHKRFADGAQREDVLRTLIYAYGHEPLIRHAFRESLIRGALSPVGFDRFQTTLTRPPKDAELVSIPE